jgi:hypothetical protein
MKRVLAAALSCVLLTTGCGTGQVRYVDLTDEGASLDRVNRSLERRGATVVLRDGTRLPVKHVSLGRECTSVTLRTPASRDTVLPTWHIDSIELSSRSRGVIGGGLTGLLTGVVLGALVGAGSFSEEDNNIIITSAGEAAIAGAVFFGAIGLGTGLVIGLLAGGQDTYDLWGAAHSDSCGQARD